MPRPRKNETIICKYFTWSLVQRDGVYQADGRSNDPPLKRRSLGTKDREKAISNLKLLDVVVAIEEGIANSSELTSTSAPLLSLDEGIALYMAHCNRPRVTGGTRKTSHTRYKPVFDKFAHFLKRLRVLSWNHVTRMHLVKYAAWLDGEGYAYATEYLELTTIKQAVKFLIGEKKLPAECWIELKLVKPTETDTYCWKPEEVKAIVNRCRTTIGLMAWLGHSNSLMVRRYYHPHNEEAQRKMRDMNFIDGFDAT